MEEMTLAERERRINAVIREAVQLFEEYRGKDITRLSLDNRDKFIQGRIASDLEISDHLLLMLRQILALYESHLKRETNTAALLFLINGIKDEVQIVDVMAEIKNVPKSLDKSEDQSE